MADEPPILPLTREELDARLSVPPNEDAGEAWAAFMLEVGREALEDLPRAIDAYASDGPGTPVSWSSLAREFPALDGLSEVAQFSRCSWKREGGGEVSGPILWAKPAVSALCRASRCARSTDGFHLARNVLGHIDSREGWFGALVSLAVSAVYWENVRRAILDSRSELEVFQFREVAENSTCPGNLRLSLAAELLSWAAESGTNSPPDSLAPIVAACPGYGANLTDLRAWIRVLPKSVPPSEGDFPTNTLKGIVLQLARLLTMRDLLILLSTAKLDQLKTGQWQIPRDLPLDPFSEEQVRAGLVRGELILWTTAPDGVDPGAEEVFQQKFPGMENFRVSSKT
jgi:hypothetical protein